jgi:acetolactate synthase-1/2/3 large subunit
MKVLVGMLLAKALQETGVSRVLTLSGGSCNPALDGFMACGIGVVNAAQERTAGRLADGLARRRRFTDLPMEDP